MIWQLIRLNEWATRPRPNGTAAVAPGPQQRDSEENDHGV
jgi:hypothetical protein